MLRWDLLTPLGNTWIQWWASVRSATSDQRVRLKPLVVSAEHSTSLDCSFRCPHPYLGPTAYYPVINTIPNACDHTGRPNSFLGPVYQPTLRSHESRSEEQRLLWTLLSCVDAWMAFRRMYRRSSYPAVNEGPARHAESIPNYKRVDMNEAC